MNRSTCSCRSKVGCGVNTGAVQVRQTVATPTG